MSDAVRVDPVPRRWLWIGSALAFAIAFAQSPGRIAADTKHDLVVDPIGFLARAGHQWSSLAPLGQVQNQAYGYFFPHGLFFAAFDLVGMPAWVTQRLWWGLLLAVGFWGVVRVADALGVGSRSARIVAAAVYALSPRVITTLGAISSETTPMMLAPWMLLPVIYALGPPERRRYGPRVYAAASAVAFALMGAVNAVATVAAAAVAGLWWLTHRPGPVWRRFTAWWIPALVVASLWWLIPLVLLGRVSPPFLDHIESAVTTTYWTSLPETLRGTGSWAPFVSGERVAGAALVGQPVLVLATGLLAAAGLAGLVLRGMPARGRLTTTLLVGLVALGIGFAGAAGSPIAEQVQVFLDGAGSPLRNVHKFEPLIRLPLVLGLAHLIGRVPLPGSAPWPAVRTAAAHPEHRPRVAVTGLVLTAAVIASAAAWTGRLAPAGTYDQVPDHWTEAAAWLSENAAGTGPDGEPDPAGDVRALVVPGSDFAVQLWGRTRDEPLQPLATTPWAVRDGIPLTPPGAIRALDSVQRLLVTGTGSDALAPTLLGQGIGYLVVRNDLDLERTGAPPPAVVHQALAASPGIERVAVFGEDFFTEPDEDIVLDSGLRIGYPAIEIYRVGDTVPVGPYTVDLGAVPVLAAGPEALLADAERRGIGATRPAPTLLAADAAAAGLHPGGVRLTDTPGLREEDYGRLDGATSALRAPGQRAHTPNTVSDYPAGDELTALDWRGASVTVSGSAADATALPRVDPSASVAAAFDGDPRTGWRSRSGAGAVGQWLRIDLDQPVTGASLVLRTDESAIGPAITEIEVRTDTGSTRAQIPAPGAEVTVPLPLGTTETIRISAVRTADRTAGRQFGLSEVAVVAGGAQVPIEAVATVPPAPDGTVVTGWTLGAGLPGRSDCVDTGEQVLCVPGLGWDVETPGPWRRAITAAAADPLLPELTVRARPGEALDELLSDPGAPRATGKAAVGDPRGAAAAAVDGDRSTVWTAAPQTRDDAVARPTLTITLPERAEVAALRLTPAAGKVPAAPEAVVVDLGTGPQYRTVDRDGLVELTAAETDTVTVTVASWADVLDHSATASGRALPGIAEITAYTDPAGTVPAAPAADPDRVITVGCADGPVIAMAGQVVRTTITATAAELRAGVPLRAEVCDGAVITPVVGEQDVDVLPGGAFSVHRLDLDVVDPVTGAPLDAAGEPAAAAPSPATAQRWDPHRRTVALDAADTDRLLVVPESVNPGWRATAGGAELTAVTVAGWQQGWIVPAGAATTVELEFTTDALYRAGLLGGLALLPLLFAAALVPARRPDPGPAARPWHLPALSAAGALAAAVLLAGWAGTVVAAVAGAGALGATIMRPGRARRWIAIVAGGSAMVSSGLLAAAPWPAADYAGHEAPTQVLALLAVLLVAVSAVPGPSGRAGAALRAAVRRCSHSTRARRAGSSTNA